MAENAQRVQLELSWKDRLADEFEQPYMQSLREFLRQEKLSRKLVYPRGDEFFAALNATPFDQVKVVILGQDPYHGPNQAHGLSFSVKPGVPLPPSLANIFGELEGDLNIKKSNHGYLKSWADQGVLLLNSILSVRAGNPGSHQNKGWERFTDAVIDRLNREREGLVFVLWGSYAQKKGAFIDRSRHLVLTSVHPSPLSSYRGFFGSRPFSKINNYLLSKGRTPIDWTLPPVESLKLEARP